MKKRILTITLTAMTAALFITGCNNINENKEYKPALTESEATPDIMTEEEPEKDDSREAAAEEKKAIEEAIPSIKEQKILQYAENIGLTKLLSDNDDLIKSVKVMETDMKTDRNGSYDITYKVAVYKDRLNGGTASKGTDRETEAVTIKETVKVVTKEDADKLIKNGETVISSNGQAYTPSTKEASSGEDKKNKTDGATDAADGSSGDTSKSSKPSSKTGSSAASTAKPSASTTKPATSTTKPSSGQSNNTNNKPSSGSSGSSGKPSSAHTHSWKPVTKVVHHDAQYTTKWVQDSAAWDEQVIVKEAWDEPYTTYDEVRHVICSDCGSYMEGWSEAAQEQHIEEHMLSGGLGGWYTNCEYIPRTAYIHHDAEYTTVHHDATGHNEQVLVKAAYDETVITGYRCSCGATK